MTFIADLHIHSRYSRATSPDMCPEGLWRWAQLKGISVIGTGDFTHPAWNAELAEKLKPLGNGLFSLRKDLETEDVPCGLMVKDYGRLLAHDATYAGRAQRVSCATRDLAEIIELHDLERIGLARGTGPRVAWLAPCTLQHGQRLRGRVELLLQAAGCTLEPTSEATLCCGSAGTYSFLQPELSGELRRRKLAALTIGRPDVIATANVGCLEHLRAASPVPVRHWIELVAEALSRAVP